MNFLNQASPLELSCSLIFFLAILHTFSVKFFNQLAAKHREGSVKENLFHLLGEVEVVFGLWAGIFVCTYVFLEGKDQAIGYLESLNFTEPFFVFVIVAICATKPILFLAEQGIEFGSKLIPLPKPLAFYVSALIIGPLRGSFITEPAAMTVTALLLFDRFYQNKISSKLKYATIGLLFVNISIGGVLTPYAAPPVLMVASTWNWDLHFMLFNFGWKAAIAVVLNTAIISYMFKEEIGKLPWKKSGASSYSVPLWVALLQVVFLALVVMNAHHMVIFVGVFLFFLGFFTATKEYQHMLKLREALLVAYFLGGLVVLGGLQRWWLEPVLTQLDALSLALGATALTAVTDNAALTYLGAQVHGLSDLSKYALVAGAVTGGGLTVIANAPNPVGYGILNSSFGSEGINPLKLLLWATPPTIVAFLSFWFL